MEDVSYNLVVRRRRVVTPGRLFHDTACNGLEVHQVIALVERWHVTDAPLPILLVRIDRLLLGSYRRHVYGA